MALPGILQCNVGSCMDFSLQTNGSKDDNGSKDRACHPQNQPIKEGT